MTAPTCPSTFILPGDPPDAVHHCNGNPNHSGNFHGADGIIWGDLAAREEHPAEPILIKTSQLWSIIEGQQADMVDASERLRLLIDLHRLRDGKCTQCGTTGYCPSAAILGIDGADDATLDRIIAGNPPAAEKESTS